MKDVKSTNNTIWHKGLVTREDRNRLNSHKSGVIWFTGLSASGKSTIAHAVEKKLFDKGIRAYVFDGDNIRHGLNVNLGFSEEDRKENIRRIVEVCKLFTDAGIIVLAAFITPLEAQRRYIRQQLTDFNYTEVYVNCGIDECIRRDPKGQYKKAKEGLIKNYTGVSSPFEEPQNPDVVLDTSRVGIEESVNLVLQSISTRISIL
jgi:adenylylsulfate kinase